MIQIPLQLQQFSAGEDLVDRHLLGHITEALADRSWVLQGIDAIHPNLTAVRCKQRGQDAQRCGLASPVRTEKAVQAGLRDLKVEVLQSLHTAVNLVQMTEFNQGHRTPMPGTGI